MIKPHCFEKDWIDSFKAQTIYAKINPPLLEKMIQALSLLQHLQVNGLQFTFKGGTSLILLLEKSNRFSVDIDIITEESQEQIEKILNAIVANSHFKSWTLDQKRSYKPGVPKAHYEIEYDSSINVNSNQVLLDILFEKAHYPTLQQLPIRSHWIETEAVINISLPTVEGIIGDKLTAFAPRTTGILYGKGKALEIIKQLYDLGNLFDKTEDMEAVAASFAAFAEQEIRYRALSIPPNEILADTIETCQIIALRDRNRQEPAKSYFAELQEGIKSFGHFLFAGRFTIDEAIVAAGKVAYLCGRLSKVDLRPLEKYNGKDLSHLEIKDPAFLVLNRLKKFADQSAFYYWYKALEADNSNENQPACPTTELLS